MKIFFLTSKTLRLAILLFASLTFLACNKPGDETPEPVDESCGVENLITDLPWLKNLINNNSSYTIHEYAFIYFYKYKGKQVVHLWNSASSANTRIVFKCDGTELISSTSTKEEWEEFESTKTEEILLWQKTPDPVDRICGVKNPLTDLPWLRNLISENGAYRLFENAHIYSYFFKGKHIIYLWNGFSSQAPEIVFNCDGTELIPPFMASNGAWEEFNNEKTNAVLLWKKN